ncbi:DNA/RNA non-specific endonuclease [Bosea vestrisii]|uniref:DNA/RNA non-specific endonuclease n=1 Tax=Bosea vestrisii TaxID=151416 RepID=A0ABW0HA04_9HYPH
MRLQSLDLDRFAEGASTAPPVPAAPPSAELVARRFKFLTADGQAASALEQEALLGTNDLVELNFLERCLLVREAVGRIKVARVGERGWATGFLIAPGLLLTNHHVFPTPDSVSTSKVAFDFWLDVSGQHPSDVEEFSLRPDLFYVANDDLDYAVVAVGSASAFGTPIADRRHVRLIPDAGKVKQDEFVTILQHPEGEPMQVALRENKVIRVANGEPFIWYSADTAHGSSGSPVFNDSLQLVALHANGRIKRNGTSYVLTKGGTTESLDGLSEADVVWEANVGFRVSRITADLLAQTKERWPERLADLEGAMRGGDVMSTAIAELKGKDMEAQPIETEIQAETMTHQRSTNTAAATASGVVIPLQLRVSLELSGGGVIAVTPETDRGVDASALETESIKLQMPIIYDGLDERDGFNARFLDDTTDAPMPKVTAAGQKLLAPLLDGSGHELKYQHFSVWMHRERRLALFTAANVDWRKRKKAVDGKSTARKALSGFPPTGVVAELWAEDPRLDARHQLPDIFYSEDRGAFDKGHIVRRDDVCWGDTFSDIQMANGDSFHVTNCSPQVKVFNQGQHGQENWGDLEDTIADITKGEAEIACIFAGPVFKADDRWFRGKDEAGSARIQIPSEFWKIIVVKSAASFEAYAFLLEQDVRKITEEEFYVTDEWIGAWKPVSEISAKMRGWLDLSDLEAIDQHGVT